MFLEILISLFLALFFFLFIENTGNKLTKEYGGI